MLLGHQVTWKSHCLQKLHSRCCLIQQQTVGQWSSRSDFVLLECSSKEIKSKQIFWVVEKWECLHFVINHLIINRTIKQKDCYRRRKIAMCKAIKLIPDSGMKESAYATYVPPQHYTSTYQKMLRVVKGDYLIKSGINSKTTEHGAEYRWNGGQISHRLSTGSLFYVLYRWFLFL